MWVAKPLSSLNDSDLHGWAGVLKRLDSRGEDTPLAQTLTWGAAIDGLSGAAFAVFSPDEGVGGIVFASGEESGGLHFECVNGPLLDWDQPQIAPRQLATFAVAVSKLDPGFGSLTLRPRWLSGKGNARVASLPVEVRSWSNAATLVVPIAATELAQMEQATRRLRRTVRVAERVGLGASIVTPTSTALARFVPALKKFGEAKEFTVPDEKWFESLLLGDDCFRVAEGIRFLLVSSGVRDLAEAQILVGLVRDRAHYLFGWESRSGSARAAVSPSAAAHWATLRALREIGVKSYDLNGYVLGAAAGHPYAGVCRFKEQFAGRLVGYEVPEIVIA